MIQVVDKSSKIKKNSMKHLRLFSSAAEYEAAKSNIEKPYVAYDCTNVYFVPAPRPIPDNEIWYTNNRVIQTTNTTGLNSLQTMGLISNTCEDGNGVMKFDKKLTSIEPYAFHSVMSFLVAITLPNSIQSIGNRAFVSVMIKKLTLPKSLTFIDEYAFYAGTITTLIVNASTPPLLGTDAFLNFRVDEIKVPAESVDAYKSASGWSNYATKIVAI